MPDVQNPDNPIESLIDAGLATSPKRSHRRFTAHRVPLSRSIDELLDEVNSDTDA